ncbi:hypothetical protein C8R43DRAFT_963684 [Mycena crocata]|nr:hypothetical protein C8R43DRAFT_963684 [Mycena crocata]
MTAPAMPLVTPARLSRTPADVKKRDPNQPAPTPAEKATRAKATQQKKEDSDAMWADIDVYYAQRAETIVVLALKHNKTPDYIKALLIDSSQFKAEHKVLLRNAVTSHIAKTETAEGIIVSFSSHVFTTQIDLTSDGSKLAEAELQARVTELIEEGISDEDAKQWMPVVLHSGGADKFCIEVCKKPALQMLQEFELWSCTRSTKKVGRDTRASMSAQIAKITEDRLRALVDDDKASASYKNFKVDIQEVWEVEIQGWPADILFVCPAQIKSVERLRRIRDGWVKETISWVAMTPEQKAELAKELAAIRATNNGVVKKRKERKDAGSTHAKPSKTLRKDKNAAKKASKSKLKSRRRRDELSNVGEEEEEEEEEQEEDEEDVDKEVRAHATMAPLQTPSSTISIAAATGSIPVPIPMHAATDAHAHTGTQELTDRSLFPMTPALMLTGNTACEEFDADYLLSLLPDFATTSFPLLDMETLGAGFGQNQAAGTSAFAPASQFPFEHDPLLSLDVQLPAAPSFESRQPVAPVFDAHHITAQWQLDAPRLVAPTSDANQLPGLQVQHHGAGKTPVDVGAVTVPPSIDLHAAPARLTVDAHNRAGAFIPYQPAPMLRDVSNGVLGKRKASGDNDAAKPAKKTKASGENPAVAPVRPKAKPRKKAAPGTSTSRTPRMGPPRATAERDAAVLAAQLPPRA